jgi:hypothetical protein
MSEVAEVMDAGGTPTLSADEEAFFSSGGEKTIPAENGGEGGEAKPAAGEAKQGDAPKNDHVPLATFLEEKKARKELSSKLTEYEKQIAEFKGKFAIIDRLKLPGEQQQVAPAGPPNPEEDIFGAVKHLTEELSGIKKESAEQKAAREASEKQAAAEKEFVDKYRAACDEFETATPDFKAAYNFLLNSRAAELKAIGYDTPQALHQALIADEMAIAQMAFEKGKSPAEMLYNLASQRGYKKESAADSKNSAAEKLETIERGQAANKSLANAGGSSGDPEMTAEALIAMPAEEFEAWCTKNPAKARRLFGG